jgi:hypothetical protein
MGDSALAAIRGGGRHASIYAGIYEDLAIDRGLDYHHPFSAMPGQGGEQSRAHYFYGHYYAVQAMYLAGGDQVGRLVAGHPGGTDRPRSGTTAPGTTRSVGDDVRERRWRSSSSRCPSGTCRSSRK